MIVNDYINSLILEQLSGTATDEQMRTLSQWCEDSASNREYFEKMKEIWMLSERFEPSEASSTIEVLPHRKCRVFAGWWKQAAVAASIAAAFLAGLMIPDRNVVSVDKTASSLSQSQAVAESSDTVRFLARRGAQSTVVLPDGSVLTLNSGSELRYLRDYGTVDRQVFLSGEAYVEVQSDEQHPFFVNAKGVTVVATGTAFNVKAYDDEPGVTTTLEHGKVSIKGKGADKNDFEIELTPNQTLIVGDRKVTYEYLSSEMHSVQPIPATVIESANAIMLNKVQTDLYTSWKDDDWTVCNEPLHSIAKKIERRYDVRITFAEDDLRDYRFSGTFKRETVSDIAKIFEATLPVNISIDRGNITISGNAGNKTVFEKASRS